MKITVPMLHTTDVYVLRDYYLSLGFEVSAAWEPDGELHWAELNFDGALIMLQKTQDDHSDRSIQDIVLYFHCEDVDELYDRWSSQGILVSAPHDEFYGWRQVFLRDPNGRLICFEQKIWQPEANKDEIMD